MSSAINSQIWNAKAANVQNQNGSPIYAGGVWSFLNSSGVTTFSVSDAGVVTLPGTSLRLGPVNTVSPSAIILDASAFVHEGKGNSVLIRTGGHISGQSESGDITLDSGSTVVTYQRAGSINLFAGSAAVVAGGSVTAKLGTGTSNGSFKVLNAASAELFKVDYAGAVTLGPDTFAGSHQINGSVIFTRSAAGGTISIASTMLADAVGTYPLKWNGTTGVVTYTSSSRHHKEAIAPISYGLNTILALNPVEYTRKSTQERELGLIADEVLPIIPEAAPLCKPEFFGLEGTELIPAGVHYEMIIPVLVKAVQQQQAQIDALRLLIKGE